MNVNNESGNKMVRNYGSYFALISMISTMGSII